MYKVAIFDDNQSRRDGLKLLIEAMGQMECSGVYEDCRDVVNNLSMSHADVVLMDINMPFVNGIEGLKLIKEHFPKTKVIMQTIFEDEDKILEAICGGADGYIIKQKSPIKLLDSIAEVMNGGAPMTPSIALKVLKLISHTQNQKNEKIQLTPREKEILEMLVEGNSYKMIAATKFISYATVNKHISNIYTKLQVNSVAGAVSKAIKEGLV